MKCLLWLYLEVGTDGRLFLAWTDGTFIMLKTANEKEI